MRNSRNLVLLDDVREMGRALAKVPSRQSIEVPPSGISGVITPGTKCDHGVYIPATSQWENHAPYCSICRPYEIAVKEHGIFQA